MFTEPLFRNRLHNPVVPPLLGSDDIENSLIYWNVFTQLLPGNALFKSVTILWRIHLLLARDLETDEYSRCYVIVG
jgi:hypothetical protein